MRRALAICGFVCLVASAGRADTVPSATAYDELVAKAEAGTAVDYNALRSAYPFSPNYEPYGTKSKPLFLDAWKALENKDCKTAMAKAAESLKINYVNFALHTVRSECLKEAGDASGSAREAAIAKGLALSLLATGDGKSTKTAYVVVTMGEERAVLANLGFGEEQQSLLTDGGHQYDSISGHDEHGKMRTALFNVDALFYGLSKQLQKGEHP